MSQYLVCVWVEREWRYFLKYHVSFSHVSNFFSWEYKHSSLTCSYKICQETRVVQNSELRNPSIHPSIHPSIILFYLSFYLSFCCLTNFQNFKTFKTFLELSKKNILTFILTNLAFLDFSGSIILFFSIHSLHSNSSCNSASCLLLQKLNWNLIGY